MKYRPYVVGIGGTTRAGSSTEKALRHLGREVERLGARWEIFCGTQLLFPSYKADNPERAPAARAMVDAIRDCDALVIASPGYHGSFSGLIKNALDYAEDLAGDSRPYLSGRAVGCIAGGFGWQAIGTTLASLRTVVHALGAWPTPMGVAINTSMKVFDESGEVVNPDVRAELHALAEQLVEFARMRHAYTPRQ
ncbi:MAG: NAD(P)H-dependent oxidoreductase [Betaproteobacteria bacterium]|nr:NAD(P)H-dependent oxidoreductase [Betaproteobacteria bacterium]